MQEYRDTRQQSLDFCAPLELDDYGLQAEAFTSPPKWHLAHTSWFFETFLLKPCLAAYRSPEPRYEVLFNSYYHGVGEQFSRPRRGLLSRPTLAEVLAYREEVDRGIETLLNDRDHPESELIRDRVVLGIEHERQHQELFFSDLKYSLAVNPLYPTYRARPAEVSPEPAPLRWSRHPGGLIELGFAGDGFCFDNEMPRHRYWLEPFDIAQRLVNNVEYQAFIDDGGYRRPELWLSDGWTAVQEHGWQAPLYWLQDGAEFTLHGVQPRLKAAPVCHLSGYEADAYARWAGARLPTEQEWEAVAATEAVSGQGVDSGRYHPAAPAEGEGLLQLYGECWQWTRSDYAPYPGYRPSPGAIGEYNGKFMSGQWVLRGGSCVSKMAQLRPSYRNFFYPPDRWQFSGIRLARSPGDA